MPRRPKPARTAHGTDEDDVKRRHKTPPPPTPHGRWWSVLEWVGPAREELALALWKSLRAVRDWADGVDQPGISRGPDRVLGAGARDEVARACEQVPELAPALEVFARLRESPDQARAGELAEACRQVREWAEVEYRLELAVLFAEAAARVDRESASLANDAARICRRATLHESAGQWYQRGYRLGARVKDHDEALRALLGNGGLMYSQGKHMEARRFFERASSRAARTRRLRQAGEAQHDLLLIAIESGTYLQGERHTSLALQYYPMNHPRLPYLAHDYGLLLIRNRIYHSALPFFRKALSFVSRPEAQALIWSNIAWAGAAVGHRETFEDAKQRALGLLKSFRDYGPAAFRNLAMGAWALRELGEATSYAISAVDLARERKDGEPERSAQEILRKIAAHELAPQEANPPAGSRINKLIRLFSVRLRWR